MFAFLCSLLTLSKKIDFTNFISTNKIERFAELDVYDLIKTVKEVFCDYFVINPDLFSLNQELSIG